MIWTRGVYWQQFARLIGKFDAFWVGKSGASIYGKTCKTRPDDRQCMNQEYSIKHRRVKTLQQLTLMTTVDADVFSILLQYYFSFGLTTATTTANIITPRICITRAHTHSRRAEGKTGREQKRKTDEKKNTDKSPKHLDAKYSYIGTNTQ